MKIRLRPFDSKQTLKLQVPNPCTILSLKQILSQNLPDSPPPDSIRLSLNRRDSLHSAAADGQTSLHSAGIAAGDLVFFSVENPSTGMNPNPTQNPVQLGTESGPEPAIGDCSTSSGSVNPLRELRSPVSAISEAKINGMGLQREETVGENGCSIDAVNPLCELGSPVSVVSEGKIEDMGLQREEEGEMEVDGDDDNGCNIDGFSTGAVDKSFSVPGFLRKVFTEELGGDGDAGRDHKLIAVAVHAVMLESGFVGFDKKANEVKNGSPLRDVWGLGIFRAPLSYTLPGCVQRAVGGGEAVKSVVLKMQSLGKFVNVYGTLDGGSGKRGTYRVELNEERLVPFLNVVWANCGIKESIGGSDGGVLGMSPEKEVFSFWRTVKDNLGLPLLIDLCEVAGLELPPCFMRLPTDLTLKILEFLPGVDVAKVSCVSSELRYLGSSDDLWKMKYAEEFGNKEKTAQGSWKKEFFTSWKIKKSRKEAGRARATPYGLDPYWIQPGRRRHPNPFMVGRVPRMIGGDYDITPFGFQTGIPHDSVNFPLRNFSPRCNLGVRRGRFV